MNSEKKSTVNQSDWGVFKTFLEDRNILKQFMLETASSQKSTTGEALTGKPFDRNDSPNFVISAFVWDLSVNGDDYWEEIHNDWTWFHNNRTPSFDEVILKFRSFLRDNNAEGAYIDGVRATHSNMTIKEVFSFEYAPGINVSRLFDTDVILWCETREGRSFWSGINRKWDEFRILNSIDGDTTKV